MSFRADGRWGGKLTSRPLPGEDASMDALADGERHELAQVWLARGASERCVADAFVIVADALLDLRAGEALVALARRAVDDEMRHAELSRVVASRFAGKELDAPAAVPLTVPAHRGASDELRRVLHVVGQCAFNETFASAFLEGALAATTGPTARSALRELLSDEIDHARVGWALLASSSPQVRAEVTRWLPPMARANLRMWRETPRAYPDDPRLQAHGAPSLAVVEGALRGALEELIVPGFESLGMDAGGIRRWMDAGMSTARDGAHLIEEHRDDCWSMDERDFRSGG